MIISLGPVTDGSNSKRPLEVARATETDLLPGFLMRDDSIKETQDAQVIPAICLIKIK